MVPVGLRMVLGHRDKRLVTGGEDVRALRDEVQGLRDDVAAVRGDLTDLAERVDFAERVLARSRDAEPGKLPGPQ
jgi:NAD(P)-dependent dehydrogenase (short-subunit alcohol dehydrogenase family)